MTVGALHHEPGGGAPSHADAPGLTTRVLREALRPLVARGHKAASQPVSRAARGAPDAGGNHERRWDLGLVVDDSPSMWIYSSFVRDFARALSAAGVFRDVVLRRFGLDDRGRPALWGAGPTSARREPGELLDPLRRRLVLVVSDGVSPMWRTGPAWTPLRRWGAAHPVALVGLVPWSVANRMGFEVHRLRLRSPEAGAPNTRLAWRPQVDVPGVFDDVGDVFPVCFTDPTPAGLHRWARLTAGADWVDAGALLVPERSPAEGATVRGTPAQLVAAYRANASPAAFDLGVCLAAAPLELGVMSRIRARMHPDAAHAVLSEFLGSPLVAAVPQERSADRGRAMFAFTSPGIREELLAFGRRGETARVRDIVRRYLAERDSDAAAFDSALDEDVVGFDDSWATAQAEHVFEAQLAGEQALSGLHLGRYRRLSSRRRHLNAGEVDPTSGTSAIVPPHMINSTSSNVHSQMSDVVPKAGGAEVTSTVDRDKEERRKTFVTPVFGGVPPRNPNFTGRADLLQELDRRLVRGATAAVLPEALHGMGGVGKSQLAIEYAYRNKAKYDVIWWIPAERSVKIVNSLVELGDRLDLNVGAEANVAVQQVLDALKSGRHPKVPANWLLIFDNADSPAAVQQYLPTGGTGRILVTSRNSQWLSVARPLEVDVFRRAESVQLLCRRDPDLTEGDASRLADALGDLPLAIAQAAAWRVETGMPASEYMELLAEKQLELLDVTTTLDYPKSVAAMWNLSLNQLKRKNSSALRLLQACAFLAPEPIARSMFTNSRNIDVLPELSRILRDRLRLTEAIRDINRFALVRIDHRTNSIEMHRLVQTVLISQMSDQERDDLRHAAHLILGANDPDSPDDSEQWSKYADLGAHLSASNAYECQEESVRGLVYNQAKFLYRWGEHEQSVNLSGRVYKIWSERLGPEHPETLRIGRWYGSMLWVVGRYAEAAEFNLALLEPHRRVFGEEHEDTIEAIGSVATDYRARGDFDEALRLSIQNYENCVRYLGDDDPVTLTAAHNLGVSYRLVGDFRAARKLDTDTWERKVQIYGQEHPISLATEVAVVIDMRETGDYIDSRAQLEGIIRVLERQNRPLNPSLLAAMRQLAVVRRKAGDHEGALAAADIALSGLVARYGPDHADTLAAALCKSVELRHHGRIGKATQLGQDTLTRYAKTFGADHPHTLCAAVNVAILRRAVGEAEGARDLDQATLDKFRARLGVDHPSTLVTAVNFASDLHELGEFQAASDLDTDTLRRLAVVHGEDHPTTLACKVNLAQDTRSLGDVDGADRLHREAVEALRHRLGAEHPAVTQLADGDRRADCDLDPIPL